ncbi:MAG: hypothetical protein K6G72_01920 [Lachnospiraceae bacterium]|nr:hypothetical protein [Lachnospiraceae bacterium]
MTSNEDYLDSLLKAAVAEDNPNSAINKVRKIESEMPKEDTEEIMEAADETLSGAIDDSLADITPADNLQVDDLLAGIEIPEAEELTTAEEIPAVKNVASVDEIPEVADIPAVDEIPAVEDIAFTEEIPAAEEIPAVEVPSIAEETPEETAARMDEALKAIEALDLSEESIEGEPATMTEPESEVSVEEEPVVEEIPVTEETPIIEEPITEEVPVIEETSAAEETPEETSESLADLIADVSLDNLADIATDEALGDLANLVSEESADGLADIVSDDSLEALGDLNLDESLEGLADLVTEEPVEAPVDETASVEPIDILSEVLPEETVSEEPAETAETDETTESADSDAEEAEEAVTSVDDLLNSDFAGEVDLPDVSSLLESAEEFAQIEAESTQNLDEESAEALDMSGDEIEKMLSDAADVKPEESVAGEGEIEIDLSDMAALEGELGIYDKNEADEAAATDIEGGGEELAEISSLLKAIDSNETESSDDLDMMEMLNAAVSQQEAEDEAVAKEKAAAKAEAEAAARAEAELKKDKKTKKKGLFSLLKKKGGEEGEKTGEENKPAKKKGKLGKLLDFLTAEEEEEGESLLNPVDAPAEGTNVTGENKEILEEMDKEGEDDKGKKKKKKKRDKKGKKGKEVEGGEEGGEGDEESEEAGGGKKGKKKKKAPKEKKERKPLELDIDTGKPLSKRNIKLVAVLAATLLLAIILVCSLIPKVIVNSGARKAYYKGDYETTYKSFYGEKKLSESDRILFTRSEIVLKMLHKYDAYKTYVKIDMAEEALDQLLQAVQNYEPWLYAAEACGATEEFKAAYSKCLNALLTDYGMSEEAAKEVIALPTDEEYSLMVHSIVTHTEYIDPTAPLPAPFVEPQSEITDEGDGSGDILDEEGN